MEWLDNLWTDFIGFWTNLFESIVDFFNGLF